jgi:hypothetical protein
MVVGGSESMDENHFERRIVVFECDDFPRSKEELLPPLEIAETQWFRDIVVGATSRIELEESGAMDNGEPLSILKKHNKKLMAKK